MVPKDKKFRSSYSNRTHGVLVDETSDRMRYLCHDPSHRRDSFDSGRLQREASRDAHAIRDPRSHGGSHGRVVGVHYNQGRARPHDDSPTPEGAGNTELLRVMCWTAYVYDLLGGRGFHVPKDSKKATAMALSDMLCKT